MAASSQERNGFEPEFDVDIWIDPYGWFHIYYNNLTTINTIYVEIEVTSGPGIDFFICDQTNWDIWDSGGTASVYRLNENVGSVSTSFSVPSTDTWYVVFDSDSYQNIHVEGYVGLAPAPPSIPDNSMMAVLIVAAVVVIGVIGVAVVKQVSRQGPTSLPPAEQIYSVPPRIDTGFCHYCGHPKQGIEAQFCAKCGRAFDDS